MINEFLSLNLPLNSGTLCFQQDGATAHTAVIIIAAFRHLFPQRVISCFGDVPWPPRSLALTTPDFLSEVYSTRPTDLHALKEIIREENAKLLRGSYRKSWATIFCKVTCFIIDKPNTPP